MPEGDPDPVSRVSRGVQRLVTSCPAWWDNRHAPGFDPLMLDLTDPRRDLLAALYGTREAGLEALEIAPEDAADYGLAARDEADNAELRRVWAIWVYASRTEALTPNPPR